MKHTTLMSAALSFVVVGFLTVGAHAADHLVKYKIVNGTIPVSLTGKPGNAAKGQKLAINRKKGNCLACHELPVQQPFQGKIGPSLHGIAQHLTAAQFRMRLVDAKKIHPTTMMPSFYRMAGLHDVLKKFKCKTIMSAQEIEDTVAYLRTLK